VATAALLIFAGSEQINRKANMNKRLLKVSSSTAVMAFAVLQALPQAYAQPGPAAEEDQRDVVVVTASRREENVQDTPLNIAAVGGAQIEEQGFTDIADVLAYVPGINVVDRGGRQGNPIIVRGLNADPIGPGDGNNDGGGTVATYLGEIPVFVDLKLNDMQRVEVLLGPQGTLYGAGTLGGAIRYIPNRPDFSGDTLSVRAEAYQYSDAGSLSTDAGFTFNKTFTDNFAIRGSVDVLNDSGFVDQPYVLLNPGVSEPDPNFGNPAQVAANLRYVEDADSEEVLSGRLAARWQPLSWLDGTLTYYYQDADIGGRRISSVRGVLPGLEDYQNTKRFLEPNKITNELLALEVTADLGFAELTSATGFSTYVEDGQRDQTDLLISLEYSYEAFPTFAAYTREEGEEERFNEEIRLVSTHEGPLQWIVGAFYNEFDSAGYSAEYTPGYAAFAGFNRPDDLEYFSQSRINLVEQALYGEVSYDFTDTLTVTVGARAYEYELKEFSAVDFPLFDPAFVAPGLSEIGNQAFDPTLGQKDDGVLGKFNIAWDVNPDLLVYGTVSQGYRIGNSNGLGPCPAYDPLATQGACALAPGQQYGPNPGDIAIRDERQYLADKTNNYEIGAKSTWLGGDLVLNGAVYFIEWVDPQVSSATVNASIPITVNAEGAESKGFEVSGDWQITDEFNVRGSYSFTQSELTAPVPDLVQTITPPGFGTAFEDGEAGDRLPGSPENQFSIFSTYAQPFMDGDLLWNFGYAWQGDVLSRAGGRGSSFTLEEFGIANASVVYDTGSWKAALFVNNLFDEFAETGVTSTSLSNQTINGANVRSFYTNVLPPRAVGVRFSWDVF
jgi:iron complex outermembrane receptor protein